MGRCDSLRKRILGSWLLCIMTVWLLFVGLAGKAFASAGGVESILSIPSDSQTVAAYIASSAGKSGTTQILTYTNNVWSFSNQKYYALEAEEKREFMETLLSTITKASLSEQMKNKMYNFIANQDTAVTNSMKYLKTDANADFVEAKKWFDPFSGVIGTVLGVLCILIFVFTGISTTIDIFYLALPGFRVVVEKGEERKKPRAVSREAYSAYYDAEGSGAYKSAYALYLKRRIWVLFLVMICVGYLISGKIYDFVVFLMDSFNV